MASVAFDRRPLSPAVRWLDVAERGAVLATFASFVSRNLHAIFDLHQAANLILVASEALVAGFVLVRRMSADVTRNPRD